MFITHIRMPRMGSSVHESTVVEWKKQTGDRVAKGEVLLAAESDKVEFEIECPADGVIKEILVEADKTVPVGESLALLETEAQVPEDAQKPRSGPPAADDWGAPVAPLSARKSTAAPPAPRKETRTARPAGGADTSKSTTRLSPRVRRLAEERGISAQALSEIPGTGDGGRITARDLESFTAGDGGAALALSFSSLAAEGEAREQRIPMSRTRRRIAENLTRSVREIPQVSSWLDVDMSRISAWREANKAPFAEKHGVRLTFTPFFALALTHALRDTEHARFNATYEDDAVIVRRYVNLGVAVDTPEGLLVPVLRAADGLDFAEMALRLEDLSRRTREGALSPEEVKEGTITLTNFGASGALGGAPIINPPQVCILGTGAIAPRPAALPGNRLAVRPLMTLSLTFDHRANDGFAAGRFLSAIRDALERMDLSQVRY
ncbi:MAG: dihydrolipoamide acetyltransferase family protein [bacterium]|nr:dihydrolipoamide acetyltransferase family protein [bacterium]